MAYRPTVLMLAIEIEVFGVVISVAGMLRMINHNCEITAKI